MLNHYKEVVDEMRILIEILQVILLIIFYRYYIQLQIITLYIMCFIIGAN